MYVALVGAGNMAIHYYATLCQLIPESHIFVVGRSTERIRRFCDSFPRSQAISGGFERWVPDERITAAIVAVDACSSLMAIKHLLKYNIVNILVEKPGAMSIGECLAMCSLLERANGMMAFNRRYFDSVQHLLGLVELEGGAKRVHAEFNDHFDRIKLLKPEVLSRIELHNFIHVIDLAIFFGGPPQYVSSCLRGANTLRWHSSWSTLAACGRNEQCTFSFSSSLLSAGPWALQIATKHSLYQLLPLEKLQRFDSGKWIEIPLEGSKDKGHLKPGLFGLVSSFLCNDTKFMLKTTQYKHLLKDVYLRLFNESSYHAQEMCIIGCGNIGSRMLQSICNDGDNGISVHLVDKNWDSLSKALETSIRSNGTQSLQYISIHQQIFSLPSSLNIAYISTDSLSRFNITMQILQFDALAILILEKVVFVEPAHFEIVRQESERLDVSVYCNIGWDVRMSSSWRKIKQMLDAETGPLDITVKGSDWGLCCNAVHMLDLFYYLRGDFNLCLEVHIQRIVPSKRHGFSEIAGDLFGESSEGDKIHLSCQVMQSVPNRMICIKKGNLTVWSDLQLCGQTLCFKYRNKPEEKLDAQTMLISEQGASIIGGIKSGEPGIPSLIDAMAYHVPFCKAVKEAVRLFGGEDDFRYT